LIEAGGKDFLEFLRLYFKAIFDILGMSSPVVTVLYVILALICIHVLAFVLGCLIGWISFIGKKSGGAKGAAVLYLLGTICFPVYVLFGLPITIIGFVGGGRQKKRNCKSVSV